jgi:hypothetical protein
LEMALQSNSDAPSREAALNRLRLGLKLGAQPLTHNQAHERH